jgi:hypothetical protein
MRGRLPQLRGRRAPGPGVPPPTAQHVAGPVAEGAEPTTVQPQVPAPAPPGLPADLPHPEAQPAEGPSFRDRGRYRRRLRYLRRVRELGFRDLGGLMHDLHRFRRDGRPLVDAKLAALDAVDRELRALERALADERPYTELREAGVAACPRCAALHATDARFCSSCGLGLRGPLAIGGVAVEPTAAVAAPPPGGAAAAMPAAHATPAAAPADGPTQTWFGPSPPAATGAHSGPPGDPAEPGDRPAQ